MNWSPQQEQALADVAAWFKNHKATRSPESQVYRLFGFAGTGKTTLARHIAKDIDGDVRFGAFTGKAALVLRNKGCRGATTIHSMIYKLDDVDRKSGEPKFKLNPESDIRYASLIIVDEVSMVGEDLGQDLLSFRVPILVLGDPAQLPPVSGAGFFTSAEPHTMLTEVHRQARDNPIIELATRVREGCKLAYGTYGEGDALCRIIPRRECVYDDLMLADQVIVGRNRTRHDFNARMREFLQHDPDVPVPGDKLVCLRNNHDKGTLNGSLWTVTGILENAPTGISMNAISDEDGDRGRKVELFTKHEFFSGSEGDLDYYDRLGTDEFTYGYALTCHKSQGSQWDNVTLFDESRVFRSDRHKWLYTALTRAAKRVTVVA